MKALLDYVALSTGTGKADEEKVDHCLKKYSQLKTVCIDVANGYSEHFVSFVKRIRDKHPDRIIWAGNVVTGEMVEELLLAGADVIKVGHWARDRFVPHGSKPVSGIPNFQPSLNVPMRHMVGRPNHSRWRV